MKTRFLFPPYFKTIGWFLFIPSLFIIVYSIFTNDLEISFLNLKVFAVFDSSQPFQTIPYHWFSIVEDNITDELMSILFIFGASFIAFSKRKNEDEYIAKIRLESLLWATYINYAILAFSIIFIYGIVFINIMMYNLFSLLIFFLIRFYFKLYQLKKGLQNEK